ncbi:MAG: DUF4392 domain-containing protein [Lachnospiraceae bacterium]|nr:DUF4392 domain-containing protein [Lachnospiraceae bacterium]
MTKGELEELNIGENLDALMNLDPRGYGVCRILYAGSRAYTGEPIAMHAAKQLVKTVHQGDFVYILTGFVLRPHKVPEMDGIVSSMLLARALVQAFDAKPVIICSELNKAAVIKMAPVVGLHCYEDLDTVAELPISMGVICFTTDPETAKTQTEDIMKKKLPTAVIAIEAPGANEKGEYHNAIGLNVTELETKSDILFQALKDRGILNIAIGDLGNETGMGTIADHIRKYVPYTAANECKCDCHGGILAATCADHIITATVSDWGCYAMMAALAFLKNDLDIFHKGEMEQEAMRVATRSGMIDMTGSLIPGIDGFNTKMNVNIVELMRQCVGYARKYEGKSDHWFSSVLEKEFF